MEEQSADVSPMAALSVSSKKGASGTGLLSKLPGFLRAPDGRSRPGPDDDDSSHSPPPRTMSHTVTQPQKSRPRKGSLRKVALLSRGAQKSKLLTVETKHSAARGRDGQGPTSSPMSDDEATGLNISDITPRPSMDGFASRSSLSKSSESSGSAATQHRGSESIVTSPNISYASTTDEEDVLQLPAHNSSPLRPDLSLSSGSESYHLNRAGVQGRRSIQHAKSPLSYSGLATTPQPPPDADWDYAETEWWGWVILFVTWFVFVIGMGSCFGVWSWAWDVGTTPYAPPELEDDPTLPIVGYYPTLMILTGVMAWVWVVVAWIGMKYFRHAKIGGD